jgi:hypothetical protein
MPMAHLMQFLRTHRETRLALGLIGFGLLGVPILVYIVGSLTLGAADASLWVFLKSLFGSLLQLRPSAWALVLGPYLLVTALRVTSRPLRRRTR